MFGLSRSFALAAATQEVGLIPFAAILTRVAPLPKERTVLGQPPRCGLGGFFGHRYNALLLRQTAAAMRRSQTIYRSWHPTPFAAKEQGDSGGTSQVG
jgi:hypothetical protein